MQSKLPVIFLAFANEYHENRYLQKLVDEYKELMGILGPVSTNDNPAGGEQVICELIIRQNVTIGEIYNICQNEHYRDRICIFHYGGHADGYQLLLQGKDGQSEAAHGKGLVSALSRLESLKLVFLNGCSTQKMARDLADRGVPVVIGTATSIADQAALTLSTRFYRGLASGLTLSAAWEWAKDEVTTAFDTRQGYRGIFVTSLEEVPERFPWDVEFQNDATRRIFEEWNLPQEARQPLFGLPPLKKQRHLPESPFLFLQPYGPEHAELFFGRARYIRDLYLRISDPGAPPMIMLYGESGSGKSSLLHAGLVPRLDAATDPDTKEPLFEVLYRRRDQDLMLAGTLFNMLSACLESLENSQENTESLTTETGASPSREQIEHLEALARQLDDEEARTYFLDSIERFRAAERVASTRAYQEQQFQLEGVDASTGPMLRKMWRDIERQSGRKLILILDQVEEVFTRPNAKMQDNNELEDLLRVLKAIFSPQENEEDEVQGKIILSYREEFNAKIEARCKDFALSRSMVFLEQLNNEDILEVFQSLEQSEANRQRYNITIEDRLPVVITDDLLKGKKSVAPGAPPIAPVLQLVLKKLWDKAYHDNPHNPQFTVELYDDIQSPEGKQMEEFFNESMAKVRRVFPELVDSGLALDLLEFHVSDLGTSGRRHISMIRDRYRHIPELYSNAPNDLIDQLVAEMKKVFLLTDNGRDYTSLPHDTLAPIIVRNYNRSDKLGQRSARILDTKRPDFVKAKQQKETNKVRLDDNDLKVIEDGIPGMRALMQVESELLRISQEERKKRMRLRRLLIQGGIVTGLFILILTVVAASLSVSMSKQLRNSVVARAHDESIKERAKPKLDKTEAIKLASFAYGQSDVIRTDVVSNLYEFYQEDHTAEGIATTPPLVRQLNFPDAINSLDYRPEVGTLIGLKNGHVHFLPAGEAEPSMLDFGAPDFNRVDFSADGKYIQIGMQEFPEPYYLLGGKDLITAPFLAIFVKTSDLKRSFPEISAYLASDSLSTLEPDLSPATEGTYEFFAYYDFFSGKFRDAYSDLNYSWEELLLDWEPFKGPFFFVDYSTRDTLPLQLEQLSKVKLHNEINNTLDVELLAKLLSYDLQQPSYNLEADLNLLPYLESRAVPLRRTSMVYSAYSELALWTPASFGNGPPVSVFTSETPTLFLRTLDTDRFLTISADTDSERSEAAIRRADGSIIALLPHASQIREAAVSPGLEQLVTITYDSVKIWDTEGRRVDSYYHPNTIQHLFSDAGSRLLTVTSESVCLWQPGALPSTTSFSAEAGYHIVHARFHPDGEHLVIGLAPRVEAPKKDMLSKTWEQLKSLFSKKKVEVVFWNANTQQIDRTFRLNAATLTDANISDDGRYASIITPVRAVVLDSHNRKRSSNIHKEIAQADDDDSQRGSGLYLSPRGQYTIRQHSEENRFDLFDLQGKPVNSYAIQSGYHQGFDGQLLTPDDRYLIAGRRNELLLWDPEDQAVRDWAEAFELSPEEKDDYNLDTFIDAMPGARQSKGWGIALMLLSLIFILLAFSGSVVRFVQQRRFLTLGIYLGIMLLTVLTMNFIWNILEEKKVFLYALFWIALAISLLNVRYDVERRKYVFLAGFGLILLLLISGAVHFFRLESLNFAKVERVYQNQLADYRQEITAIYLADKNSYLQQAVYYLDRPPMEENELSPAEIEELFGKLGYVRPVIRYDKEWKYLLTGFLVVIGLLLIVVIPLLRFAANYRAGRRERAYNWLQLPTFYAGLGFWSTLVFAFEEDIWSGEIFFILSAIAGIVMLVYIVRQSRRYLAERRYGRLTVFAIATVLAAMSSYALAAGVSLVKGWYARRKKEHRRTFLFDSLAAFLVSGGLYATGMFEYIINKREFLFGLLETIIITLLIFGYFVWIRKWSRPLLRITGSIVAWLGVALLLSNLDLANMEMQAVIPVVVLLAVIFYGIDRQFARISARRAAGRSPWPNIAAIAGLLAAITPVIFLFILTHMWAMGELIAPEDTPEYYEEDYLYEEPGVEDLYGEELSENEAILPDTVDEDIPTVEEENVPPSVTEDIQETTAPAAADVEASPVAPALQGLLNDLFSPDEEPRDAARREIVAYYTSDPALVPALVQLNYDNPSLNEGIWNTLFILEQLPAEQFLTHRDLLLPYLDWAGGKGYGPSTMERIEGLRGRM